MLSSVILGTGNIANHLFRAFNETDKVKVIQVVGRNKEALQSFSSIVATSNDFSKIADADIYLLAIKDDAIATMSKHLSAKKGIVAHTSGAMPIDCLKTTNKGVFYPLQTFTKDRVLSFKTVPICIEGQYESVVKTLKFLGNTISNSTYEIISPQRKKLHIAAVFANNFVNHLYRISERLCEEETLPFELLKPLIKETAEKVQLLSPRDAQTGPARRNDQKTIESHLGQLKNEKLTELYTLLSEAIKNEYEKELQRAIK